VIAGLWRDGFKVAGDQGKRPAKLSNWRVSSQYWHRPERRPINVAVTGCFSGVAAARDSVPGRRN